MVDRRLVRYDLHAGTHSTAGSEPCDSAQLYLFGGRRKIRTEERRPQGRQAQCLETSRVTSHEAIGGHVVAGSSRAALVPRLASSYRFWSTGMTGLLGPLRHSFPALLPSLPSLLASTLPALLPISGPTTPPRSSTNTPSRPPQVLLQHDLASHAPRVVR